MSTSGAKANTSGRLLEETVTRTICGWLPEIKILLAKDRTHEDPPLLVRHVPYRSIYGTPSKTEFVLVLPDKSIRIECKWQSVSGSVDEKYPYMFLNMSTVGEDEVVFLLDGDGAKRAAIQWLKSACQGHTGKPKMSVHTISSFVGWVQHGCK